MQAVDTFRKTDDENPAQGNKVKREEAAGDVDEEQGEVAVVTRSMARRQTQEQQETSLEEGIGELFTIPQMDEPQDLAAGPGRDDVAKQSGESRSKKGWPGQERLDARSTSAQGGSGERVLLPATHQQLVQVQREDPELKTLLQEALKKEEAASELSCYYHEDGLLKRKWRSPKAPCEEHQTYHQIVLPQKYREEVIRIAHEETAAHLGA
ncbi:hypothetical protein E2C01_074232 [Portunus trituberculatus]|uniref:Uncharacterized protein n=1 Tax=Portunus trituberculatus TaxID=210409 RepID=A0A5B7I2V1_PORTR|nr:hypothetical protein [Portunus trituberculatus]